MLNSSGIKLITEVVSKFEKTKTDLQKGILLCREQINKNGEKINQLEEEAKQNAMAAKTAESIIDNINKMLG